jgi:trimeric autotransporter adhesin
VEKVDPPLVVHDEQGKPFTVRYEAVNAMLLNEFLKEHGTVQELRATVAQQQRAMEALVAQIKEQQAEIQKVSAQLAVAGPARQMVFNTQ